MTIDVNVDNLPIKTQRLIREAIDFGCLVDFISTDPLVMKISKKDKDLMFYKTHIPLNLKNSVLLANDKQITKELLEIRGIDTPHGIVASNMETALAEAISSNLSFPLATKPIDGSCGVGITVDIRDRDALVIALKKIEEVQRTHKMLKDKRMIVEEMAIGNDHRVLVLDGQTIACAMRVPASVTGDGVSSLKRLTEIFNDSRPSSYRIALDEEVKSSLSKRNLNVSSVPILGEVIQLRKNANVSMGGRSVDMTGRLSRRFRSICIAAANALNLRFAGVDIFTADITAEDEGQPYRILEVNGNLIDFDIHEKPVVEGPGVNVAKIVIRSLFGENPESHA